MEETDERNRPLAPRDRMCPARDTGYIRKGRTAHVKDQTDTLKSAVCRHPQDNEGCPALRRPILLNRLTLISVVSA